MSVAQLGRLAGLDDDETLLQLWDAGLDRYKEARDRLRRQDVDAARRAVGLPSTGQLSSPSYWVGRLDLSPNELRALLVEFGIPSLVLAGLQPLDEVEQTLGLPGT